MAEAFAEHDIEAESLKELKAELRQTKKHLAKLSAFGNALEDIVSEHDLARYL